MRKTGWVLGGWTVGVVVAVLLWGVHPVSAKPSPQAGYKKSKAVAKAKVTGPTAAKSKPPVAVSKSRRKATVAAGAEKKQAAEKPSNRKVKLIAKSSPPTSAKAARKSRLEKGTRTAKSRVSERRARSIAKGAKGRDSRWEARHLRPARATAGRGAKRILVLKEGKNHVPVKTWVLARRQEPRDGLFDVPAPATRAFAPLPKPSVPRAPVKDTFDPPPLPKHRNFSPEKAGFVVKFNGERLGHRVTSAFVLPGDEIFLEAGANEPHRRNEYAVKTSLGKERQLGTHRWYWQAPRATGLYFARVTNRSGEAVHLNVFVMVPAGEMDGEYLNGYRIGRYPTASARQLPIYTPPRGFIEVTAENENTPVSPHFRLRQFLCKQDGQYPKYMLLDPRLLLALELLLERVNQRGIPARTFEVLSGYRTPHYNRAIGNSTTYSRHAWGDAADIFIDENPRDGRMDDLNFDGEIDSHDAGVLYDIVDGGYDPRFQQLPVGGLARYRETSSHGPFVHVDVRGLYARWGVPTARRVSTGATGLPRLPGEDSVLTP